METKQLQIVTYDQAKKLKALGFNRVNNPCHEAELEREEKQ
jgi:hypothetical protein